MPMPRFPPKIDVVYTDVFCVVWEEQDNNNVFDGKADGQIINGKAYSYCSQVCSRPICGDNKVGLKLKAGNS